MAKDLSKMVRDFRKVLTSNKRKTSGYETIAEVVRVDDNIAWVHIDGGVTQTPAVMAVDCKKGDKVKVRINNRSASISGNLTAPPTDDTSVKQLKEEILDGDLGISGEDGQDGEDAINVTRIVIEHCLANANAIPEGSGTISERFETIRYTAWSESIPQMVDGKYYWRRTVTYFEDGTVVYGNPFLDLEAQVMYESEQAIQAAASAAEAAQEAAETAAEEAGGAQEAAEQAKDDALDLYRDQVKHFWYDTSSGAHVSQAENSIATGAAVNATANNLTFTQDGYILASLGRNSLNFYDGDYSSGRIGDLLAAYSKSGTTFYTNKYRSTSLTNSAVTFWDPTDTSNSGTANQRKMAIFAKNSAQFYVNGNIATSWAANALNFYDGTGSATATNDLLASYTKDGAVLYAKQENASVSKKVASFTRTGVTFWDPTDGQTAQAIFGSSGISFNNAIPFTIGNTSGSSYIQWYNAGTTASPNWKIRIAADQITLGGQSVTPGGQGAPGDSAYIHIRYSANANGSPMTTTPNSNTRYIGIYTDSNETASTSPGDYDWTRYVGEDVSSQYLTEITNNGLFVHRTGTGYSSDPTATGAYGVWINDSADIIKDGRTVASFGDVIDMSGKATSTYYSTKIRISGTGLYFYDHQSNEIGGLVFEFKNRMAYGTLLNLNSIGSYIYAMKPGGHNTGTVDEGAIDFVAYRSRAATMYTDGSFAIRGKYTTFDGGLFKTATKTYDNWSISSTSTDSQDVDISETGFTPIAIRGYEISSASSNGANMSRCRVMGVYIKSNTAATFKVRNDSSSTEGNAKIKIEVRILYMRTSAYADVADDPSDTIPRGQ